MGISLENSGIGIQMDSLWGNPTPQASFSPQKISIPNISKYDLVYIVPLDVGGTILPAVTCTTVPGQYGKIVQSYYEFNYRDFVIRSDGIEFMDSRRVPNYASGNVINNAAAIPYLIYGIKL